MYTYNYAAGTSTVCKCTAHVHTARVHSYQALSSHTPTYLTTVPVLAGLHTLRRRRNRAELRSRRTVSQWRGQRSVLTRHLVAIPSPWCCLWDVGCDHHSHSAKRTSHHNPSWREQKVQQMLSQIHNFLPVTFAKMVAISEECPNGSICQATLGRASSPKFSSTNLSPEGKSKQVWS